MRLDGAGPRAGLRSALVAVLARWRALLLALAAVGGVVLALKTIVGSSDELLSAADVAVHPSVGWLVAAAGVEALSFGCAGAAYRRLLPVGGPRPKTRILAAIAVVSQTLSNVLPAGYVVQNAFVFGALRQRGIEGAAVGRLLLVNSGLDMVALALIALVGTAVAGQSSAAADVRLGAFVLLGLVAGIALAVLVVVRRGLWRRVLAAALARGERVWKRLSRRPFPNVDEVLSHLRTARLSRRAVVSAEGWLFTSWVCDAACLALAFYGVSGSPPWRLLLLSYAAGQLAAILPVTPGGLGVVEGSITLALVAYGGARERTLAAVLLYRLISYWAIVPAGAICYGLLRRGHRDVTHQTAAS